MKRKSHTNTSSRGTIGDMPAIKELRSSIFVFTLLSLLSGNKDVRNNLRGISEEVDDLVSLVDNFYCLLGSRHWVFSSVLNLDRMKTVVSQNTPEDAESELIKYFKEKDTLHWMITRLNRFPEMRTRIPLLEKAKHDYLEGRYYSSILVTISVMDGFVNDISKFEGRKGLHAREPEELYSKNSVATVWEGLPSIHRTFTKSFHMRKDTKINEVYRHGIMHGMTTNYDNDVVATKAWCMLFAVGDWADDKIEAREKTEEDHQTLAQTLKNHCENLRRISEDQQRLGEWQKHYVDLEHPNEADRELKENCIHFLEAWKTKNYGRLGTFFPNFVGKTIRAQAGEANGIYSSHPIENYEIREIERPAPGIALVKIKFYSPAKAWSTVIRFVRFNDGYPVAEWRQGEWKVMQYATAPFAEIRIDE